MNAPRLDGLDSDASQQVIAAAQALAIGRADQAEIQLGPARKRYSEHPEVLRLYAGIASLRGRHGEAIASMRQAVALRPRDALYYNTLGTVLGASGDFDTAITELKRACELQPGLGVAWFNLGVMLSRCVRTDEAAQALQRAVQIDPDNAEAHALLADLLRMRGRSEQSAAEYRRLLQARPWSGSAWWGLAALRSGALTAGDVGKLSAALGNSQVPDDDRIAIGFALAKAFDEQGRYDEALGALKQANGIARLRGKWNASAFSATVDAINRAFQPPVASASPAALGAGAIFIVGLPRSGTTLVEQILASHSAVEGAGELPDLPLVLAEESRRRGAPYPDWVKTAQPDDWLRLGERYLERTAHWRRRRPHFTDKLPANWMNIGAIRAMLPGAHIIACRRDPLETCFSCYRQLLPEGSEYARTPEDLCAFWTDFNRTVEGFAAVHASHLHQHSYEGLLAHPEASIRRLLEACGLPFEAACLAFHETTREVRSPSASQVRRPLDPNTARAPHYGALLDPFRKGLGLPLLGG
ncbi:MAG: tetratricopeptide repeat protein [Rhodanobacteraceae bacterium]|nr:MAG: tetratricopeptide repeat protein [Rhodanobacteraceae bacterium]